MLLGLIGSESLLLTNAGSSKCMPWAEGHHLIELTTKGLSEERVVLQALGGVASIKLYCIWLVFDKRKRFF